MNNKTLASVVREAREKLGISQRELSRQTGVDNNTIAKIEKGLRKKPNILSLRKLGIVLNIELKELLKLAGYDDKDIEAAVNNSYASMVFARSGTPVFVVPNLIDNLQDEIYLKQALVEILDNIDLENLDSIKSLPVRARKKAIKLLKEYKKEASRTVSSNYEKIEHLEKLLNNKNND